MIRRNSIIRTTWLLCSIAMTAGVLNGRGAANQNPGVIPINSSPAGKSYGEWAAAWWQWVLAIPAAQNPMLDTTGDYAGINQSGPVWFLESTFGNSAERTIAIPAGKSIFVPLQPWIFGASVGDCEPSGIGTCDVATLRTAAANAATATQTLDVTLDSVPLKNTFKYRATSPSDFSITLPPDNALQALGISSDVAGVYSPQVADGYWMMLAPLSPGTHTLTIHIVSPDYSIDATITSHLVIQ